MDYDQVRNYFEGLGFELAHIDDSPIFFMDLDDAEDLECYALLTDMDGNTPSSLTEPIIWSVYDENDSFQWSVTIENAEYLKRLFEDTDNLEEVLESLQNLREDNIYESEQYSDM